MAVYQLLIAIFSVSSLLVTVKGQIGPQGPPPQCPEGKVFKSCGTACPRTCDNLGQLISCTRQCVIGCFCPSGTVENGDGGCVEPSNCPGQTPMLPSTTSVSSSLKVVRTTPLTTTIFPVTTNSSTSNTNLQTKIGIIAGSSAAAAVILIVLILVVLLTIILVRKANSRMEESSGSSKLPAGNGISSNGTEKNLVPVEANAAYAVTTQGNIAYTATEKNSTYDCEEYTYI